MSTTIPYRTQPSTSAIERPPSRSSHAGSNKSSSVQSGTLSHYKITSQTSLARHSSHNSVRSSRQPLTTVQNGSRRRSRRLKSQYPLYSAEPHVEYILVASFDIDRGPVMEHQYPGAISPDENMLAELMMPDQTHVREQDWTMFFLHKDAATGEDDVADKEERKAERRQRRLERAQRRTAGEPDVEDTFDEDDDSEDDSDSEPDGPPLMYVLNLVNTKEDATARRGAVVKAMAICTRHSFLHIYKPLLLLALEDYFKSPVPDTLELLYNALNAMDLSLMPRLTLPERHLLQGNDAKDLFVEKFERMIEQRAEDEASGNVDYLPDSPTKLTSSSNKYAVPRDTHELESKVSYNGIPVPVKIPTAPCIETVGDFSLVQLIQTFDNLHKSQPQPFALHPHLTTSGAYTHPILVLVNAMLTQKRVIFLGYNRPSGEVVEAVLAACALASGGVLRGFTRHAFPYTDLTKIDELLKVPGFIAGVTNPAFSYHPEWWDLLCDLESGRMKISSSIEAAPVTEGSTFFQQHGHSLLSLQKDSSQDATGDTQFMEDIMSSIADRQGESIIRSKFRAYITKFTRIAAAFEETVYGASSLIVLPSNEVEKPEAANGGSRLSTASGTRLLKGHGYVWPHDEAKHRELAASAARIEGWRNTRSYYAFISDLANHTRDPGTPLSPTDSSRAPNRAPIKPYLDLYHCMAKLRTLRLNPAEAGQIYLALEAYCDDYNSILELLEMAPLSEAGLFHVSLGLWHEEARVRDATAVLLDRVRKHPAGRIFFARLGGFVNTGFVRAWTEREARLHQSM